MKNTILLLLIVLVLPLLGNAQPWIRDPGHGYAQVGYSSIIYSGLHISDSTGELPLDREVFDITWALYSEIGISDKWMLTLNIPFKLTRTNENETEKAGLFNLPAGELNGFGNVAVRGSYRHLSIGKWVFSPAFTLTTNTSSFDRTTGLRTGYDAWGFAPSYHAGFGSRYFFAKANAGLNFRTNSYSTQFLSQVEAGLQFFQGRVFLVADLDFQVSFENGSYNDETSIATGLYLDEQTFTAFLFKAGVKPVDHFYLWVSSGAGTGNFVARAPSFNVSLAYEW